MARVALTVQNVAVTGTTVSYTNGDSANGHEFANDGDVIVHVVNGGAGAIVATFPTPSTFKGLAVEDVAVTVGAGAEKMIGPFDRGAFNQAGGLVYINLDDDTSVTLAAVRVPR